MVFSVTDDQQRRQPSRLPVGGQFATTTKTETGTTVSPALFWPAVDWEELAWKSSLPPDRLSRATREEMADPYRAAIVPDIADLEVRLPRQTAALAEEASVLIRDFDREAAGQLPFAAGLLGTESAASSRIERITADAQQVALAELGEDAKRNATLIVGNVHAMQAAIEMSDVVNGDTILAMHRALLERTDPAIAGKWREEQVWIGGGAHSPHRALFVPPAAHRVSSAIDDLTVFAAREDIPALAHAAITHAQFETIHPFPDGNGRTGRALVHAVLRKRALTRSVTVPVSAGLLVDTRGYFAALSAYRQGDPAPIVDAMSAAAFSAIANGRTLVTELQVAKGGWVSQLKARSDSAVWPLMDLVLRQPVVNTTVVQAQLGVSHTNAMKAIGRLVEIGALAEVGGRRRSILWQASEVLGALDGFAERAGRRWLGQPAEE